ncbi:MAG: histidinol dehydrogenase [Chloroflexota bacterium]|nr:histidinol dehydrogenase [Chloroflexota bacterium]
MATAAAGTAERTGGLPIARFDDLEEARRVLLGRRALEDTPLPDAVRDKIREVFGADLGPGEVVDRIIRDVRAEGDTAVRRYTRAIDGRDVEELRVPTEALDAAAKSISNDLYAGLEAAAERVRQFHERARRNTWIDFAGDGATGQIIRPLARVGIYAPGGRVPYPSSVLMAAIPARVAGVREVVMASPTGPDGEVAPALLAAAKIAGVDAVYRMGGAQAIAALAYGTQSVGRVDKILGPGNLFVTLAKQKVYGAVGIDGLAGPTECLLVADGTANPRFLAADLIAQAEHDPLAQPILLCTSRATIEATLAEAERMLETAERAEIIRSSAAARGAVVLVPSIEAGIAFANEYAPEHLALCFADAWSKLGLVENAGGVFVGEWSVESIGDYTAGPSHIMPTGGTARFSSPLNLDDFLKITSVFAFGPGDLRRLGPPAMAIAHAEGLYAHAEAIDVRLSELDGEEPR